MTRPLHICKSRSCNSNPIARRGGLSCGWIWLCRSVLFLSREWPEPSSSAAGVRSYALATAFAEWGWSVSYLRCSLDAPLGRGPFFA